MRLESKVPAGPIEDKWDNHKFSVKLVNPANKRRFKIIIVGSGLAGASAAATLGELGYEVKVFTFHDSPRRAHSIAAQGGINAAKNYHSDGDSVYRLFYDTVKGGDYRSREANVYRLADVSLDIIDQATAQGVPFAREYGGLLDNRSFGGAQVSRTFYARGATGQQLLLGAYQALMRQVDLGRVTLHPRTEMLDVVVNDGIASGIVVRDLVNGEVYANFFATFSRAPVTIFYVISMGILAVHLYHGTWSMFQSVGINNPRFNAWRRGFAIGLAVLVGVGNAIMPLAVLFGFVGA